MKENQVQGGKADVHNSTTKSSLPKGDVNNTGVKNGVGVPNTTGDKKISTDLTGSQTNQKTRFSNERHIF